MERGRVGAARPKAAIPVAWTFMSEILTKHGRMIERLPRSNNRRFDRVLWPYDGHECPSCRSSLDGQQLNDEVQRCIGGHRRR